MHRGHQSRILLVDRPNRLTADGQGEPQAVDSVSLKKGMLSSIFISGTQILTCAIVQCGTVPLFTVPLAGEGF